MSRETLNNAKTMCRTDEGDGKYHYLFWCPGCRHPHLFKIGNWGRGWTWDGNFDLPTFSPSLLNTRPGVTCHLVVRAGQIEFCGDCAHPLAGKTVPLPTFTWDIEVEFDDPTSPEASPSTPNTKGE